MNLSQLESKPEIEDYFHMITEKNFTPLITSQTRITSSAKTLIDNILFNEFSSNIISDNLTVGISDHMSRFALIPKMPLGGVAVIPHHLLNMPGNTRTQIYLFSTKI